MLKKLTKIDNIYSARLIINKKQRQKILIFIVLLLYILVLFSKQFVVVIFLISNLLFLANFISKIFLVSLGIYLNYKISKNNVIEELIDLPIYSILIPIYKEEEVLESLIEALNSIDYPKDLLDIKLIIESDDLSTINKINTIKLDNHYKIITVPYSSPRTKAKACNYALKQVKGKYTAIYDAEDVPDPLQLKKVIAKFKNSQENVICIQAKLNFYNRNENILTRLFSLEYLLLFNFMLPALEFLNIPIPLGGTSNHFITEKLIKLGGWDPYNVTEDAELGIRLSRAKFKTSMVDSITLEEAPINIDIWFKQRARWIKGYIQTYIVHMRKPSTLYNQLGFKGFIGVQFFIGIFTLTFILTPFTIVSWLIFTITNDFHFLMPLIITILWKINLLLNLVNMVKFKTVVEISKVKLNIQTIMLHPIYFLLISITSFRAIIQLFFKPYHWDKTTHGISKYKKNKLFKN